MTTPLSWRPISEQLAIRRAQDAARKGETTGRHETPSVRAAREQQERIQQKAASGGTLTASERRALDRAEGIITSAAKTSFEADERTASRARTMREGGATDEQIAAATGVGQVVSVRSDAGIGVTATVEDPRTGRIQRFRDDFSPGEVRGRYFELDRPATRLPRDDQGRTAMQQSIAYNVATGGQASRPQIDFPVYGPPRVRTYTVPDDFRATPQATVGPVRNPSSFVEFFQRQRSIVAARARAVFSPDEFTIREDRDAGIDFGVQIVGVAAGAGAAQLGTRLLGAAGTAARSIWPMVGVAGADVGLRGVEVARRVGDGSVNLPTAIGEQAVGAAGTIGLGYGLSRVVTRSVPTITSRIRGARVLDSRQTQTRTGEEAVRSRVVLDVRRQDAIGQVQDLTVDQQLLRQATGRTTGQVFIRDVDATGRMTVRGPTVTRSFTVDRPMTGVEVRRVDTMVPRSVLLEGFEAPSGLRPVTLISEQQGLFASRIQTITGVGRGFTGQLTPSEASVLLGRHTMIAARGTGPIEIGQVQARTVTIAGGRVGAFLDSGPTIGSGSPTWGRRGQIAIPRGTFEPSSTGLFGSGVAPPVTRTTPAGVVRTTPTRATPTLLPLVDTPTRTIPAGFGNIITTSLPRTQQEWTRAESVITPSPVFDTTSGIDSVIIPSPTVMPLQSVLADPAPRVEFFGVPSSQTRPVTGGRGIPRTRTQPVPDDFTIPIPIPDATPSPVPRATPGFSPRTIPRFTFGPFTPRGPATGRWPLWTWPTIPSLPGPAQRSRRGLFDGTNVFSRNVLNVPSLTASVFDSQASRRRRRKTRTSDFFIGTELRF